MDTNDLDKTIPRPREDSPRRQMAMSLAQLINVLISCGILARLPFRLLLRLADVCKAWRHRILGETERRLRDDSPSKQIASPPVQLPDDLIYLGILARLPFRQLLRFAVVCKAWRDIILGDPAFARVQARCPSPASVGLARLHRGRLEVLTPGAVVTVSPPDASLSFLPVAGAELHLCSATSGLLCLIEDATGTFFVVNPATRAFRAVPYAGQGGPMACLAYDPSIVHRKGYRIVVPVQETYDTCVFWSFSSAASRGGGGWRLSGAEVHLTPHDVVRSKPVYLGGRAHWLCNRGGVVWHDVWAADTAAGALPAPLPPLSLLAEGERRCLEGNRELVAWHGRIGIVFAGIYSGLAVWALSSTSSSARWEMVHWKRWDEIAGGVARSASQFLWSVVPAGMESGGEKAMGLAVRIAHGGDHEEYVWRRELLRYDMRTGATAVVAELAGREKHDNFGAVFGYHSSMAPLE
jgi:hypothetical protein